MILQRRWMTITLALLTLSAIGSANQGEPPATTAEASPLAVYHDDPEHLWNRLHRMLFGREWGYDTVFGLDDTQLLYWGNTEHLIEGVSHGETIAMLDEFLDENGETLIEDPLKRAILQRDLWTLFDWTIKSQVWNSNETREVRLAAHKLALQKRLVAVMRRIALTAEQIEALPDNYSLAAQSGAYPSEADTVTRGAPYLPPDLLNEETGPWVRIFGAGADRGAELHVRHMDGRSLFWVYLRTPGGRDATWDYLVKLRDFGRPYEAITLDRDSDQSLLGLSSRISSHTNVIESSELPQLPAGSQAALVEQALLIDHTGAIRPTRLTLKVQLRVFKDFEKREPADPVYELRLYRRALFGGQSGGLVAMGVEDRVFPGFGAHDFDAFQWRRNQSRNRDPSMMEALRCTSCHGHNGIYSFNSRHRIIGLPGRSMPQQGLNQTFRGESVTEDKPLPRSYDESAAIHWKKQQYSWGRLEGLWMNVE